MKRVRISKNKPGGRPPLAVKIAKYSAVLMLVGLVAVCLGQRRPRASTLSIIQLPEANSSGSMSLEEALAKEKPARQFTGQPLKPAQMGQLAWAGLVTRERPAQPLVVPQTPLPAASPAEPVYPIQLHLATQDGVYLYNPDFHSLQQTFNQDVRPGLAAATANPAAAASAGCDIILTSLLRNLSIRSTSKARQLILLQAGHVAQNIQLQAVSLGLGSVAIGDFDSGNVKKVCTLPRNLEALYIVAVGYPSELAPTEAAAVPGTLPPAGQVPARPRAVVFIIPGENFRDEELFVTGRVLEMAGVQTIVASTKTGPVRGMLGSVAEARILLNGVRVDDCDAIVFVGGLGTRLYFDNPVALNIVREAAAKKKVLAAISTAPTILANAGVLKGVRVTGSSSERVTLERAGARYTGTPVERDGLIITAAGPVMAADFGRAIADALAGR
jgi:protease I